jgi:hypothetical protein
MIVTIKMATIRDRADGNQNESLMYLEKGPEPKSALFLFQLPEKDSSTMNNNILYLAVGGLAVGIVALGYNFYQQDQAPAPAAIQVSVAKPDLVDHRDHNRDHNRIHDNNYGGQHGGDNSGRDQNGHNPNE